MAGVVHRACLADCHGSLSLSPLIPVVTKDSTLNLPRDLLLFSSPFLRTLLPSSACSSPALYLPDCSASDLNHLISLLQNGVSSALPLSNLLVTSRRVESIAAMLGLPLGESLVPLVNNSPSPSVPLAPQLSRDSGISSPNLRVRQDLIEQVKQEKEDNLIDEEVEGDRSTEPRSDAEHNHEDEGQDMLDDNIAEDLGDIADTSLNLDDFEDDTAASDAMMSKDNVNEAQEEPFRHICEICEISLQTNEKLFTHLLNDHFYVKLVEGNKNSVNSKACYECYTDIPNQDKLLRHLATKHGKLNNLLDEHGFKRVEVEDWESSDEEQDVQEPIDTVIKKEKNRKRKYGNTQDLLNNIDLLIGGAELEEDEKVYVTRKSRRLK